LVHSADDKTVPVANSILFYEALVKQKVPAEMHLYPEGGHGYCFAIGKGRLQGMDRSFI
jgi:dipeptidyl aminopeptidase/acylaminoacyl peptidase